MPLPSRIRTPEPDKRPRNVVAPPPHSADSRLLVTLNQAAGLMTISRRTLERLISAGEFPAPLKIGRASRVDREDIANYLERLREERGDRIGSS